MSFLKKVQAKTFGKGFEKHRTTEPKVGSKLTAKQLEIDIKALLKDIEAQVEDLSQLRYQLADLAKTGDKKAKELYEGWTRVVHLYLGEGLEQVGQKDARWHSDY